MRAVTTARLSAMAVVAALCWAAPASAAKKTNPLQLSYSNDTELAALQLALNAAIEIGSALSDGRDPQPMVASASAPDGLTPHVLAKALGKVLAAASLDSEALSTLGDPLPWPMPNRQAFFRLPEYGIPIKCVCVFVPGCYHGPESWFYHSKRCPQCTGLPEEVAHTKGCLAHGCAVLAVAAKDQSRQRCFSSSGDPSVSDQQDVADTVRSFRDHFGLNRVPTYMWGISSGAGFAIKFPLTMWVDGIVSEVNMPWEKSWGATDGNGHLRIRFPPTAYYMMQRDLQTKRQIEKAVAILRNNGVPADYIYVPTQPVTDTFLSDRVIYINPAQSAQIVAGLKAIGVINSQGWLNYDPRMKPGWLRKLPMVVPWLKNSSPYYGLITDASSITEELNYAYAWHEIVGEYVRCTLMWLDSRGKANLNSLCQQYGYGTQLVCLNERQEGCPYVAPTPSPSPPPPPKHHLHPSPPPLKPRPAFPPPKHHQNATAPPPKRKEHPPAPPPQPRNHTAPPPRVVAGPPPPKHAL